MLAHPIPGSSPSRPPSIKSKGSQQSPVKSIRSSRQESGVFQESWNRDDLVSPISVISNTTISSSGQFTQLPTTNRPMTSTSTVIVKDSPQKAKSEPSVDSANNQVQTDGLVQMLCDYQDGLEWMLNRVKQDIQTSKEVVTYMERRAVIEEEYGRSMAKLAQQMQQEQEKKQGKQGSFALGWSHLLKTTESIGENRLKFAESLTGISHELNIVRQDAERSRKQLKEAGVKYQKQMVDAESHLTKAKAKYDVCVEDLERARFHHNSDQWTMASTKKKSLNPIGLFQKKKTEEDFWTLYYQAVEALKYQIATSNQLRQEYFATHLPYLIKSLKDTNDECDLAMQALLLKFSTICEESILADATHVSPLNDDSVSLKRMLTQIDNGKDFLDYINQFLNAAAKLDHQPIQMDLQFENRQNSAVRVFGVDLDQVMSGNGMQVPEPLRNCIQYLDSYGLRTRELYRMNGTPENIQQLREALDMENQKMNIRESAWAKDIHSISAVVKQYLKELPEPLLTSDRYQAFMNAARLENPVQRLQAVHAIINELPDANYVVLRFLAGHLSRVASMASVNNMTAQHLSVVFGPILMGCTGGQTEKDRSAMLKEIHEQCLVVELIVDGYSTIFEPTA